MSARVMLRSTLYAGTVSIGYAYVTCAQDGTILSVLMRIAGFVVLVLLAIGFFILGLVIAGGAPHAFAANPGLGIAFIAIGVSCAAAAGVPLPPLAPAVSALSRAPTPQPPLPIPRRAPRLLSPAIAFPL